MRLGVLASHPIQNQAPIFRELARRCDLQVYFAHRQTPDGQSAAGFGVPFEWDVDLLSGYASRFLDNRARRPTTNRFLGCNTPAIRAEIEAGRFDAFVVSGWGLLSYWQAVRACRAAKVPVLIRGDSQLAGHRSPALRLAKAMSYPMLLRAFDGFLYVGRRNRQYLVHYGVPLDRLYFSPHCIDNDAFAQSARQGARQDDDSRSPRSPWRILFSGKIVPGKRPFDLIEAAAILRARDHPAEVVFLGSGSLEEQLRLKATERGVPAEFLGFRNQTELPPIYAAASVVVLPSEWETWGLVVNEAMACGTPAVVSEAVGCGPDLVESGHTGAVFPVGDTAALATAIEGVLRLDPRALRRHISTKLAVYSPARAAEGILTAARARAKAKQGARI